MAGKPPPTPTLQLVSDLFAQMRRLIAAEMSLAQAELAENASAASRGATALAAGAALLGAGLVILMAAASLALVRLGAPIDLAFLIVAVVAMTVGLLLLRSAGRALQFGRLVPMRSLAQIFSLFGRP
jgi:hypothetical protein